MYTVPPTTKLASDRWNYGHEMTQSHIALKDAVGKALDSGLFYNRDVDEFVANLLGVTQYDRDIDKRSAEGRRVEGGPFAYDVYLARKEVESERFAKSDAIVRDKLALYAGQKIGKITPNDFKQVRGCIVEELTESFVTVIGSRGKLKVRVKCSYTALQTYIERANKKHD